MIPSDEAWPDPSEAGDGQLAVAEADPVGDRIGRLKKAATAFRTISEVADDLHVPQHVLRFWETRFPQVKPLKRGGGRRYYRPDDVMLLRRISDLLYVQGYTIKGVQRLLIEGDGGLQGDLPAPDAADAPDDAPDDALDDAPDHADAADPGGMADPDGLEPLDVLHPLGAFDPGFSQSADLRMLREVFRETLSVILAELEAIRRLLPA